ncbi:ATP-binding protein [Parabacteroides sp. OttesenSCG-928-G06]|nr:ATP-binding protein [Parabacteroides sp. OttesenSCG-928-G06]
MDNLSFHITDITANSVRAKASEIYLSVTEKQGERIISVIDNGCGMDAETLQQATDPFYTTRTTRRIGLGLPFLKQNAEQTGGNLTVCSTPGEGTTIRATFVADHLDCPPWGDLAITVALLITGNPDVNVRFLYETDSKEFSIQTSEIKEALEGIPLSHPRVTTWLTELIRENLAP